VGPVKRSAALSKGKTLSPTRYEMFRIGVACHILMTIDIKKIAFEGERRHGGCDGYHSSLRKNDTLEKTPQFAGGRLSPSGRPPNSPLKIKEVLAACGIAAPFSFFPTCALML